MEQLEMLRAVNPDGAEATHVEVLPYLNKYAKSYDLSHSKAIAHFLSQVAHESGFRATTEDLRYAPTRMRQVFGCAGNQRGYDVATDECRIDVRKIKPKLWTEENNYAYNPENLGNYVYADRFENGNEASGDGYRYRGRGLIQLTFKSNYRVFTENHNARSPDDIQDFVTNPDLLINSIKYGVESAFFYWFNKPNLASSATTSTVRQITRLVSGGENGLADRRNRFNRVALLLNVAVDI